ncbi:MAG: geranylgeranyl reductase family protein [Chloroflexota bacterium]|nr:geranylgeranyl reductase family protein [Chloroflexota bacterium]
MSHDAEIIIVGAGPAGSAAAIAASQLGRRVLLLDRARFPRDKPCGDLIGARALRLARILGIDHEVVDRYRPLSGVQVTTDAGSLNLSPTGTAGRAFVDSSDARIIPRETFDAAMMAAAIRTGASLETVTVRSVDSEGAQRVVRGTSRGGEIKLRAPLVIIAGGYGCRVASDVAPSPDERAEERPHGIAMRGYFRNVSSPPREIVFSLDEWVLPGYGWVFPLPGGMANVGIGSLVGKGQGESEHLHQLYHRYVNDPSSPIAQWMADVEPVGKPRTWPLDLGPRPRRLVAAGLLVAGESAGFVGPMTGAGIAFALESGMKAGEIASAALARGNTSANALNPYARWAVRHPLAWLKVEERAHWLISDPARLRRVVRVTRPLPVTPAIGAKLLLNLG